MNKKSKPDEINTPRTSLALLRLSAKGSVTGEAVEQLEEEFSMRLAASQAKEVILDLTAVNALDSRGISVCVGVLRECQAAKRAFSVEANPAVFRLLTLINLNRVMTIREIAS